MINKRIKTMLSTLTILSFSIILIACGGGGAGGSGSTNDHNANDNLNKTGIAISIDSMATIPVLDNNSTSTYGILRNNGTGTASVTVTATPNYTNTHSNSGTSSINSMVNSAKQSLKIKNSTLSSTCEVSSGGTCQFPIQTGIMSAQNSQGSILITASWNDNKGSHSVSNIVNAQWVDNSQANGVVLSSDLVSINSTAIGNGVLYAYGSGQGQIYNITSISTNNQAVSLTQNNLVGTTIPSGFVQAIPVTFPVTGSTYVGAVSLNSAVSLNGMKISTMGLSGLSAYNGYTSNANIGVLALVNGGYLISGNAPIIDTSKESSPSIINVTNVGNATATSVIITPSNGITESDTCGATLGAGATCNITYTVPSTPPQQGSINTVKIQYNGGAGTSSTLQNIYWYNSINGNLIALSASQNPLVFNSGLALGVESGATTTITATNAGGFPVTINNLTNYATGSIIVSESAGTCTGTLKPGTSCNFYVNVKDKVAESNQIINLYFTGTTNGTAYTNVYTLKYTSNPYTPLLVMPPLNLLTMYGDGINTENESFTITNVGSAPALLKNFALTGIPNITAKESPCIAGGILAKNSSCVATINFAAKLESTLITESGTAIYNVTYQTSGAESPTNIIATQNIPYQILPNFQGLTITNVSMSPVTSGAGSTASPYSISGATLPSTTLTLTYANQGTRAVTVNGVQNNFVNPAWVSSSNSCTGLRAVGSTCTISYTNQYGSLAQYIPLSNMNLNAPYLIYTDTSGTQYVAQPNLPANIGGSVINANVTLASVTNAASITQQTVAGTSPTMIVTHTAIIPSGYNSIQVKTQMENYFVSQSGPSGACTYSASNGIMTETCTLTLANPTVSTTYSIDPNIFLGGDSTIDLIFSIPSATVSPAGAGVTMNSSYANVTVYRTTR